ncbi:MAG: hypothetical protein HOW73_45800 [Polyangiaceae bacterium]|nr:hypothetical protein [Polyangiaceae bacterium]
MSKTLFSLVLAALGLCTACGPSSDAKTADDSAASDTTAEPASTGTSDTPADASADGDKKPEAGDTSKSTGPAPAAKIDEKPKDANALVLNLTYSMKGGGKVDAGTSDELQKAALERIATSAKLASPASKVDKPRSVNVTVMLDEPKNDKKGLTVKMGLVGVEPDGKCPLFDIDQNFTLSDAKSTDANDVLALRRSAIIALLDKLESEAGTLKPTANCTAFKKK